MNDKAHLVIWSDDPVFDEETRTQTRVYLQGTETELHSGSVSRGSLKSSFLREINRKNHPGLRTHSTPLRLQAVQKTVLPNSPPSMRPATSRVLRASTPHWPRVASSSRGVPARAGLDLLSDALQRSYMSLRRKTRFSAPARSEDEEHTHKKPRGHQESYLIWATVSWPVTRECVAPGRGQRAACWRLKKDREGWFLREEILWERGGSVNGWADGDGCAGK